MTEADWNTCNNPEPMLEFLRTAGRASDRKLRLCAAACCRRIWHFLLCHRCREAVRCAELYADGLLGEREREEAIRQTLDAFIPLGAAADALSCGTWTALDILPTDDERHRYEAVYQRAYQEARHGGGDADEAWEAGQAALAAYRVLVDDAGGCYALFHAAKAVAHGCRAAQAEAAVPPDTLHACQYPWHYAEPEVAYRARRPRRIGQAVWPHRGEFRQPVPAAPGHRSLPARMERGSGRPTGLGRLRRAIPPRGHPRPRPPRRPGQRPRRRRRY